MASPAKRLELAEDLTNWMAKLPLSLRNTPIIYLAIPGSHDSMTSTISSSSKVAPDAEPVIQCLKFLGPLMRVVVSRWARTQDYGVTDQLKAGIRYFDLRIATKKGTDKLFFVHGLYADEVEKIFTEMVKFLEDHPKEVIILDCQHFYAFEDIDHQRLMSLFTTTFNAKLVPYMRDMSKMSLEFLTSNNMYQVVAIYRSDAARDNQPLLWPSDCFPTPWPNTDSIETLLSRLERTLNNRNSNKAFVSQCILTPSSEFVTKHLFSSLKNKCAIPLHKKQYEWLLKQKPGPRGINIVINDFVDLKSSQFAKEIINLNSKLII